MQNKKRGTVIQKLTDLLDIPSSVLPWGMDVEIHSDFDIFVDGCRSISEYTREKVVFLLQTDEDHGRGR